MHLLAVSGKMASGKDSLAHAALHQAGYTNLVQINIADQIRHELDTLLVTARTRGTDAVRAELEQLAAQTSTPVDAEIERIVEAIGCELAAQARGDYRDDAVYGQHASARRRTGSIRTALQNLAWIWRTIDPDHWINITITRALAAAQAGSTVLTTDVREPAEVHALHKAGYLNVRILVTAKTQAERLSERDDLAPDPDALNHPNETALDHLTPEVRAKFAALIPNNGTLAQGAQTLAHVIKENWGRA